MTAEDLEFSSKNMIKNNKKGIKWIIILSFTFSVLLLLAFIYWLFIGRFYESTDDAYVAGNSIQIMSQISGHVVGIFADETDMVQKGDKVVVLDKADAEIALSKAESDLALVVRQVNQYYDRVKQAQANVALQQNNLERAQEDFQRREGLSVNKTISAEELRHSKLAMNGAEDSLSLAKQELASAITLVGSSDLYHHPQVQQAIVSYRHAFLDWRRTTIYAPDTGYVAKRSVQVGEEITPATVLMMIVPINQLWVDANFKETQLRDIRIGQSVEMESDVFGSSMKYHGKVLGLNPGTGSAFDILPPQNATGNWIKIVQRLPVRISIDCDEMHKEPLRIGLSMTVTVDTHNRKGDILSKPSQQKMIYETKDYELDSKMADQKINEILKKNASNIVLPSNQVNGN